jgi:hypothetical protein
LGLTADLGVRIDRYDLLVSATHASPRVNIAFQAGGGTVLHASCDNSRRRSDVTLFREISAPSYSVSSPREAAPFCTRLERVAGGTAEDPMFAV